jgi:hypothetical protein
MYRKLKRTWSHSNANYIPNFQTVFPELKNLSSRELCDRLIKLKLDFYHEEKTPVSLLRRLTLPFALIMYLLLVIGLPFTFLITGRWGYSLGQNNYILNWFRSLGLN